MSVISMDTSDDSDDDFSMGNNEDICLFDDESDEENDIFNNQVHIDQSVV